MLFLVIAGIAVLALFVVAAVIDMRDRGQGRFDADSRRPAMSRRQMRKQLRQRAALHRLGAMPDGQDWRTSGRRGRRPADFWD